MAREHQQVQSRPARAQPEVSLDLRPFPLPHELDPDEAGATDEQQRSTSRDETAAPEISLDLRPFPLPHELGPEEVASREHAVESQPGPAT